MMRFLTTLIIVFAASAAEAQHQHAHSGPYAGFEARAVKALSEQQLADLRAGRGMQLALAAELNGYPGPAHVLELAFELDLTEQQRTRTQALFEAMKAESVPIGERLIQQEAELDRLFAAKSVTAANLADATHGIGATQATLRAAHLKYHVSMLEVLTPAQVARYMELRGYARH
jgi:Spy/CpxP family protein refolding chaperone